MAETTNDKLAPEASELDAVRAKLDATEQELNNYKLRLADFENARKRLAARCGGRAEVRDRAAGARSARGAR